MQVSCESCEAFDLGYHTLTLISRSSASLACIISSQPQATLCSLHSRAIALPRLLLTVRATSHSTGNKSDGGYSASCRLVSWHPLLVQHLGLTIQIRGNSRNSARVMAQEKATMERTTRTRLGHWSFPPRAKKRTRSRRGCSRRAKQSESRRHVCHCKENRTPADHRVLPHSFALLVFEPHRVDLVDLSRDQRSIFERQGDSPNDLWAEKRVVP